jgi:hypothetical protein
VLPPLVSHITPSGCARLTVIGSHASCLPTPLICSDAISRKIAGTETLTAGRPIFGMRLHLTD